jgi:hypothetical protein
MAELLAIPLTLLVSTPFIFAERQVIHLAIKPLASAACKTSL